MQLPFPRQACVVLLIGLPLADRIGTELIGWLAKLPRETLNGSDVSAYDLCREVTSREFFQHEFASLVTMASFVTTDLPARA